MLNARAGDMAFDQRPIGGTSASDLDLELFRSAYLPAAVDADVLAENDRTVEQQLSSLGLLDPASVEARGLGVLLVGFDASASIPGAYLQFVRYEGNDPAFNVVDQEELRGNLIGSLVTHRDYEHFNAPVRILWFDDRIEITSPGGPYGVVTKDTFDQRNDYRNPALAAAMKTLGYVNRFGRGIALVRAALERNGNPPAEYQVEDSYWSVTVRRAP